MKKFFYFLAVTLSFALTAAPFVAVAQDSPLQAAPGEPPPPQGWNNGAPDNAGIHLPAKKKKSKLKFRMASPDSQKSVPRIDSPAAHGETPNVKKSSTQQPGSQGTQAPPPP